MIELGPESVSKKKQQNFHWTLQEKEWGKGGGGVGGAFSVPAMASFLPYMKNVAVLKVYFWPASHYNDLWREWN